MVRRSKQYLYALSSAVTDVTGPLIIGNAAASPVQALRTFASVTSAPIRPMMISFCSGSSRLKKPLVLNNAERSPFRVPAAAATDASIALAVAWVAPHHSMVSTLSNPLRTRDAVPFGSTTLASMAPYCPAPRTSSDLLSVRLR